MENNKDLIKAEKEQTIILNNRKNFSVSGTNKIISLSPELIQLNTNFGNLLISGNNLELIKLDDQTTKAEISGDINSIKFVDSKTKQSFLRKLFK